LPDWLVKVIGFEHTGPLPRWNVAVTDAWPSSRRCTGSVPVHAPLKPANVEPLVGVAVNETDVPLRKLAAASRAEVIPARGGDRTAAARVTVSTNFVRRPARGTRNGG